MIGIWPLSLQYRSLEAYTSALLDTAETVGVAHVGIGTDMFGLGGSTVIPGYEQLPQIAELLARHGLSATGIAGIMGANYLRVLKEAIEAG